MLSTNLNTTNYNRLLIHKSFKPSYINAGNYNNQDIVSFSGANKRIASKKVGIFAIGAFFLSLLGGCATTIKTTQPVLVNDTEQTIKVKEAPKPELPVSIVIEPDTVSKKPSFNFEANTSGLPITAVVDVFNKVCPDKSDTDKDGILDNVPHGISVEILSGGKDNVLRIESTQDCRLTIETIVNALDQVVNHINNGNNTNIRTVNISSSFDRSYDSLSMLVGTEVNSTNIDEKYFEIIDIMRDKKAQLEEKLNNKDSKLTFMEKIDLDITNDIIRLFDLIDELADKGIPVVIASGNTDHLITPTSHFNLLTLNPRAISVGYFAHSNKNGSFQNDLVDVYINGFLIANQMAHYIDSEFLYELSSVKQMLKDNPNMSEDQIRNELGMKRFSIQGSSFASPRISEIVKHLAVNQGMSVDQINEELNQSAKEAESKFVDPYIYIWQKYGLDK